MKSSFLFRMFLGGYLALLGAHVLEDLGRASVWGTGAFALGVAFAFFAHSRAGSLLFALLLVHMSTEWAGYGAHGFAHEPRALMLQGTHIAMDTVLLWLVAQETFPARRALAYGAALASAGLAYLLASSIGHAPHEDHEHVGALELLVLGGIAGCSAYHLARGRLA